jgi:predicted  nucleic acid-binding Zn-ribbon protein
MGLLANLLTLHRVDAQVRALRSRVDNAKIFFNAQEKQLALLERQRVELETQLKQLKAVVHSLETDQAAAQERIDKLRSELNMSTNDKQYKAILNELKVLENQKDETVKRAVEEMSRIDETQKRIELHAATTAERAKVRELAKAKLDECMKDVGERLSELESERERAADLIPDRERKIFDRVAEETEGEAMADVTIVSLRHREFACGACNIEVPFETYAKLSSAADAVVQCKACTRILYLSEETRGASNEEKSAEKSAEKPKSESSRKTRATAGAAASSGGDLDPNSPEAIARDKAKFEKTRKL